MGADERPGTGKGGAGGRAPQERAGWEEVGGGTPAPGPAGGAAPLSVQGYGRAAFQGYLRASSMNFVVICLGVFLRFFLEKQKFKQCLLCIV